MSGSSDWVHCNKCYRTPAICNGVPFYFSSCGHILCRKCITQPDNKPAKACPVCTKACGFLEINRNLKPEIQQFFRNPHDVAAQFMAQLKKVLEFQANNRTRLMKYTNEKSTQMQKYAENVQAEMRKRQESEKKALDERKELILEVERCKQQVEKLNSRLEQKEKELAQARGPSRGSSDSGFSSAMEMSFQDFVTSTPIQGPSPADKRNRSSDRKHVPAIFGKGSSKLSPIAQDPLSTPALLGIKGSRRSTARSAPPHDFFNGDVEMGGF